MSTLAPPTGGWQLLVADNGSSDDTRAVLTRFEDRLPLRQFHCPEPGKNAALNCLLPHVEGDLVVFTDDDVLPAPDWLQCHRALADAHPSFTVFGGRIIPEWEVAAPEWIRKSIPYGACFGETSPDWAEGETVPGRVWGANMSVRSALFSRGLHFDAATGPRADNPRYLTGGETQLVKRLHAAGYRAWFSHAPLVRHIIRPEQVEYRAVMQRAFRLGRLRGSREVTTARALCGLRLRQGVLEARSLWRFLRWALSPGSPRRAAEDWQLNVARGQHYQRALAARHRRADSESAAVAGQSPRPLLRIPLTPPLAPGTRPFFSGRRSRIATVTAVKLLSEHRLLATHLNGCRLYLVDFDAALGIFAIRAELATTFGGEDAKTDLLDTNADGLIALSNLRKRSATLYQLNEDTLTHVRDLPIPVEKPGYCHGVKFSPTGDTVGLACTSEEKCVYLIAVATGGLRYSFTMPGVHPKDLCFIDDTRMVVLYAAASPTREPQEAYASRLILLDIDLAAGRHRIRSELVLPDCQGDCCVFRDGHVYLTDQMDDCVTVVKVIDDRLHFECKLRGYDFPHGVDVLPAHNLIAVTNYGSSEVVIHRLDEMLAASHPDLAPRRAIHHSQPLPEPAPS